MQGDDTLSMGMSGGPIIEGTWYNPTTGDSFTARDTYLEGDELYVMTMDGRRISGDMLTSYIQSDTPVQKKPQIDPNQPQVNNQQLLQDVDIDDEMNKEINNLINNTQPAPTNQSLSMGIARQETQVYNKQEGKIEDEDTILIRRMLSRGSEPTINVDIKWNKFPIKQMDMLDTMAVDMDKICDYYISKIDLSIIRESLRESIYKYINKQLSDTTQEITNITKPKSNAKRK